jgi:hypothetical protein
VSWQSKARAIVDSGSWPAGITAQDRDAVEQLAAGSEHEPYCTMQALLVGIETGTYRPGPVHISEALRSARLLPEDSES